MPAGVFRSVFLIGEIAIKLPRLRHFLGGMRSNRWEREMWRTWRPYFGWSTLCPVLFSDPTGLVIVMCRAEQPITQAEVDSLPDAYPGITAEAKLQDYGRCGGRVVAVDYGLWDADQVAVRRDYYRSFATGTKAHFIREERDVYRPINYGRILAKSSPAFSQGRTISNYFSFSNAISTTSVD